MTSIEFYIMIIRINQDDDHSLLIMLSKSLLGDHLVWSSKRVDMGKRHW